MRPGYSVIEATNWYAYVSNNPVKYVDPTGMFEGDIDDAVNDNLEEQYIPGENDCDQWVQDVLEEGGFAITREDWWTPAANATVAQHIVDAEEAGVLQDEPAVGTNVGLSDDGHTILLHLNEDGTVEVAHTSSSNRTGESERYNYNNMEEFRSYWLGTYRFVPIPNTAASSGNEASSNTESANSSPPVQQQKKKK